MTFAKRGKLSRDRAQEIVDAVEAQRAEEPLLSEACLAINAGTTADRLKYARNVLAGKLYPPRISEMGDDDDELVDGEDEDDAGGEDVAVSGGSCRVVILSGSVDQVRELLRDFV